MTDIMLPFRKKPVVIDAVQINTIEDAWRAPGVCTGGITCKSKGAPDDARPHVHTLEGDHSWTPGDYLIRGVKGEYYFCKPDIFEMTYEPATAEPSSSSSTAQTDQRDTSEPNPSDSSKAEPVAWNCIYPSYGHFTLRRHEAEQALNDGANVTPLFAAPPQPQGVTPRMALCLSEALGISEDKAEWALECVMRDRAAIAGGK